MKEPNGQEKSGCERSQRKDVQPERKIRQPRGTAGLSGSVCPGCDREPAENNPPRANFGKNPEFLGAKSFAIVVILAKLIFVSSRLVSGIGPGLNV